MGGRWTARVPQAAAWADVEGGGEVARCALRLDPANAFQRSKASSSSRKVPLSEKNRAEAREADAEAGRGLRGLSATAIDGGTLLAPAQPFIGGRNNMRKLE